MLKKSVIAILIVTLIIAALPAISAEAESDRVLLVYNDAAKMSVISDLIKACGRVPVAVESTEYNNEMIDEYQYIVLQEAEPLNAAIQSGKSIICLGNEFEAVPGIHTETIGKDASATLSVYNNKQSIIIGSGDKYIYQYTGESVGYMKIGCNDHPIGVISGKIMYAPYFSGDDISVFAVAQMMNLYFGNQDGGMMYVMIDEVYPFEDVDMLELTAEKLYKNGIPFIMSVMPAYFNTDYPSFKRYSNALKFVQSKSGSLIMHDPIIMPEYELVGDDLDVRMENAYNYFEENGVHVFEQTAFPFTVSIEMLAKIEPTNELFVSLPIDTVIKYDVFESEEEIDSAIEIINKKWLQIGDYGKNISDAEYIYEETEIDEDYVYRPKEEKTFEFLVDTGNQTLIILVVFSLIIIMILMIVGYRLYRLKFIRKRK